MNKFAAKVTVRFLLAAAAFFFMAFFGGNGAIVGESVGEPFNKPLAVGSPAELATHFEKCWTSGDNGLPSHVIYRYDGDWKVGGSAKVGEALDMIFENGKSEMTIYSFCKEKNNG